MEIDWPGIRAAAVSLNSVRDAAMRAASDLPPDEQTRFVERVNKRAYRERWLDEAKALSKPRDNGSMVLSKPVQSGADVLASVSRDTRMSLAIAAGKAGKAFEGKTGDELIELAKPFHQITSAAGMIGGWGEKGQDHGGDMLILSIGGNVNLGQQVIDGVPRSDDATN